MFRKKKNFMIHNVKRKWEIRYSVQFLAQQKEPLNKQNSRTPHYSTYFRFQVRFFATMTIQGICFHQ